MKPIQSDDDKIMEAMEYLDKATALMRSIVGERSVAGLTPPPIDEAFLNRPVRAVDFGDFTVRLRQLWKHAFIISEWGTRISRQIVTVRDLVSMKEHELLRVENIGQRGVDRIKVVLAAHGLHLGMIDRKPVGSFETAEQMELHRLRALVKALVEQGVGTQEWVNAYNKMIEAEENDLKGHDIEEQEHA